MEKPEKYDETNFREIFYHHSVRRGEKEYGVTVCILERNGFAHARGVSVRMPGDPGPRSLGLKSKAFGNKLARERARKALRIHGHLRRLADLAYSLVEEACSYENILHYGKANRTGLHLSKGETEIIKRIYKYKRN